MGPIVFIDFVGLDEENSIKSLLAGVKHEPTRPPEAPTFPGPQGHSVPKPEHFPGMIGMLVEVPDLPPNFLPRDEEKKGIKKLILSENKKTTGITGVSRKVGVQGMGAIGKSVLAAAVAQDDDVRRAFPDGIFWLSIGRDIREADLLKIQSRLAKRLGEGRVFKSLNEGSEKLRELLAGKNYLLILDDVWKAREAGAFDSLGPNCRMLITTRNADVITDLGGAEYTFGLLEVPEARKLLADWAGQDVDSLPQEADEIVHECSRLPLALAMTGAMLRGKPDRWRNVLHKLQNADLDRIRRDFPHYPYHDLLKAIQVSVDDLDPDLQVRYLDFAVFPEDTPIPESVLQTFWAPEGLDEDESQDAVDLFVARSLARRSVDGRLSLHDLQLDYVKKQASDLKILHNRLLESYRSEYIGSFPRCWAEGPNDCYFFQHLARHLIDAGRKDELRTLLLDFDWIKSKLEATDVPSLVADYDLLPEDSDAGLVRDALRLSSHVITADKAQLASQILGRLMALPSLLIQALLDGAGKKEDEPWIRPLAPSLTPPGTPLLRTLKGHAGWVNAVAVSPDGRRAVSGSWDSTLKVWDLDRGEEIRTLKGHSGGVRAVGVSPDGRRAVSGSNDHTLKVWDLERGEVVATFTGEGLILCCAVGPNGVTIVAGESPGRVHFLRLENG